MQGTEWLRKQIKDLDDDRYGEWVPSGHLVMMAFVSPFWRPSGRVHMLTAACSVCSARSLSEDWSRRAS